MKKNLSKIYPFFLPFLILFLLYPYLVKAQTGLEISFSPDPLFYEPNFLPGDSSSGEIIVKNNTGEKQEIYLWAKNIADPSNFSQALNLKIEKEGSVIYSNTLFHFFSLDKLFLSEIANNNNQSQYDLILSFDINAGNEYQAKGLQFDLLVGSIVSGEDGDGGEGTTLPVFIGGGGGAGLPIGFDIFNVRSEKITENSASVTWQTTLFSTSQVIYSAEDEPHNFDLLNPPKYGYSHIYPLPEDLTMVTFHTILLSGLKPCATYYFRVLSHQASADSLNISPEYSFATLCFLAEEKEEKQEIVELEVPITEISLDELFGITQEEVIEEEEIEEEKIAEEETIKEKPVLRPVTMLAALRDAFTNLGRILGSLFSCLSWWLILVFAIFPLMKGIAALEESKKEVSPLLKKYFQKQGNIWLISCLIPLILAIYLFLSKHFCLPIWLFLVLILVIIFGWYLDQEITKGKLKTLRG